MSCAGVSDDSLTTYHEEHAVFLRGVLAMKKKCLSIEATARRGCTRSADLAEIDQSSASEEAQVAGLLIVIRGSGRKPTRNQSKIIGFVLIHVTCLSTALEMLTGINVKQTNETNENETNEQMRLALTWSLR